MDTQRFKNGDDNLNFYLVKVENHARPVAFFRFEFDANAWVANNYSGRSVVESIARTQLLDAQFVHDNF